MSSFLYKPIGQGEVGGGRATFLINNTNLVSGGWYDSSGNLVERFGRFQGQPEGNSPPGVKFYAGQPGPAYGENLTARFTDRSGQVYTYTIPNGSLRYTGDYTNPESLTVDHSHDGLNPGTSVIPGTNVVNPFLANPALINFQPINYSPISAAPYNFVDPLKEAQRYADFNTKQEQSAFDTGLQRADTLFGLDTKQQLGYIDTMAAKQQSLVAAENAFNQTQRLAAVNRGVPQAQGVLNDELKRAQTLASGRLLSDSEDRAYELAARSASGDSTFQRGFGDDSIFGKRTSDILSAEQRLGLTQTGTSMLNNWLSQASSLLIDTPLKASLSQQLRAQPPILPSQYATQQQANLTNLTTLPAQFGISSQINQQQFQTQLEQGTRTFNATNTLAKDQFNSSGGFQASVAQFNAQMANYDRVNAANQAAQNQVNQEAHDQAASQAANANQNAQQNAGTIGAIGSVVGAAASIGASVIGLSAPLPSNVAAGQPQTGQQALQYSMGNGNPVQASYAPAQAGGAVGPAIAPPSSGEQPVFQGGGGSGQPVSSSSGQGPTAIQRTASTSGGFSSGSQPTYQQAAATMGQVGGMIQSVGAVGAASPALASFGAGLSSSSNAASNFISNGASSSTPQGKLAIADHLQSQALSNAQSSSEASSIQQTYSQVKDNLNNGVQVSGDAHAISNFINNFDSYSHTDRLRGLVDASFKGTDIAARLGIEHVTADSVGQAKIPGTNNTLTVGNVITLQNSGYNVYSLVNHWDELEGIQKAIGGASTPLSIASTAKNMGLLGGVTPESQARTAVAINSVGAKPAGAYGVGAVSAPVATANALKGAGFSLIGTVEKGTQVIGVPLTSLASTATSSGLIGSGNSVPAALQTSTDPKTLPAVPAVSYSAYNVAQSWPEETRGKPNGPLANASIAAGMYRLGAGGADVPNPLLLGGVLLGTLAQTTGAEGNQEGRNSLRAAAQSAGLIDKEGNITLAGGTKFNLDNVPQSSWENPLLVRGDQKHISTLNPWDVDYTKDLNAVTQVSGNALSLLLYGDGTNPHVSQMGNYFTNAAVSSANTSSALTPEAYDGSMKNMQKMFVDAGIKSKFDAYTLSNQLFHEGRVNQTQLVSIQQGINSAFDPPDQAYDAAHRLLEGVKLSREQAIPL